MCGHDGRFAGLGSKIGPKPPPSYLWKANIHWLNNIVVVLMWNDTLLIYEVHYVAPSYFLPSTSKNIISSSADPAQCWSDTTNSFMVWTMSSYQISSGCGWLMVPCPDNMTPCRKVILLMWNGCIGGRFSPPPSTFWRHCGNRTSPECTILVWRWGRCSTGAILVAAFMLAARRMICYQCDVLITHRALTS